LASVGSLIALDVAAALSGKGLLIDVSVLGAVEDLLVQLDVAQTLSG
jgi:hypothetical protein